MPITLDRLDQITDAEYQEILAKIDLEARSLLTRTSERIEDEATVIAALTKTVESCCQQFTVHQYGSTTFGFGGSVDLNLFVQTGELPNYVPKCVLKFIFFMHTTHIKSFFYDNHSR